MKMVGQGFIIGIRQYIIMEEDEEVKIWRWWYLPRQQPFQFSQRVISIIPRFSWTSLVAQTLQNPPAMQETWVWSPSSEDPLEKGMATHSSILAWRIHMDREAWWATVHGVAREYGHDWAIKRLSTQTEEMVFCCSSVCFHSKVENSMMRQTDIVFFSPFNLLYVIESVHSSSEYFLGTYWSRSWRCISEQSRQKIHALQSLHSNKGRLQTEKFSCYRRLKDERKGLLKGRLTSLGSKSPTLGFLHLALVSHSLAQPCLTYLILTCSPTRVLPSYHMSPSSLSLQQALPYLKIKHPCPCSSLGGSHSQRPPSGVLGCGAFSS